MKRLIFVLLSILASTFIAQAQPIEVSFGSNIDNPIYRGNDYVRLIGADSDGLFAIRMDENDDLFLEYYDSFSMMQQSSSQLVLPSVSGIQAKFLEMFYIDGKLILFTVVLNNTIKQKDLYVQYINESGKIIGDSQLIGRLLDQNIACDFDVELTSNKQNIFIHYFRPFSKYNEEPFYFKVMGSDLEMIIDKQVKLPMNNLNFDILQYELHKSGKIYMLAKITPEQRRKSNKGQIIYQYRLLVYDIDMKKVDNYDIRAAKFVLKDMMFAIDYDGNADVYATMSRKNKNELEGFFHKRLDIEEGNWMRADSKKANYKFERSEKPSFRNERVSEIYNQMYNYKLRDILYLSNGGSIVIAEHENHWVDSTVDPHTKEAVYYNYYKFNDIILSYTNSDNNMVWMRRIPKSQWSYNDYGKYSSFFATTKLNWVVLCYNDHSKNVKNMHKKVLDGDKYKACRLPERIGVPMVVSVFPDGDVTGYQMFDGKHKKYKIVPEMITEFNDTYYMFTKKANNAAFGSFKIILRQSED